ncbi:LOW QUALITY PROTEIN: pyrethroid hydrolase Ces2e-like [Phascolarctos cinereus]|uniref:Carboxylic ester hydrolase n=1 Tax=Phascolarctos cinereus TaxID=38626 RepID=A0A6P5KHH9_PHACI|nr:LOW QUALITY PROTEIN: pyrethroid hydrolase Ces2e-like [Phascolarctos cinereus]
MWKLSLLPKVLTLGVLGLLIPAQGHHDDDLIRTTEYGQVQGSHISIKGLDKDVNIFMGIPFARPPIGDLRFSPPQPPEPWSDVRNATSHPPMCLQNVTILEKLITFLKINISVTANSEDCLYLNIYVPDHTEEDAKLPVMVWIHGGGLIFGSASMFDGSILSATQNVVVVTIQYRLGILGFFSTGDEHASGNWGYLDQVAALRWVQKNIAHFGGDPGRVTIFGESAGGTSVSSHILSPMSKGLFHRAIMESGVAILPGLISSSSESIIHQFANLSAWENYSSASIVEFLRNKTEREILAISKAFKTLAGVVDGKFFPKHPEDLLASGKFHHVPSIIGVNNHEYGWLIPVSLGISKFKEEMTRETIREILLSPLMRMPPAIVYIMMNEYLGSTEDPQELRAQFQEMMGDLVFVIPALRVARYQQSPSSPVYFYEFQHRSSIFKGSKPDFVKADHGDELHFVFGAPLLGGATEEEKLFSRKIMTYWANFARNGDPNGADLLHWPAYNQNEEYLQLDLQPSVGKGLKADKMEFWLKILPQKKEAVDPDAQDS